MTQPTYGIKQTIRYEWVRYTAELMQRGLQASEIRAVLSEYLNERKGTGNHGTRSDNTRDFVLSNLMRTWVTPLPALQYLRDHALTLLTQRTDGEIHALHWGLMCATYPFWYNTARHVGRLLLLQGNTTTKQVQTRLIEQYGQTQTVTRYSQYVMRSFIAWDAIHDTQTAGTAVAAPLRLIEHPAVVGFLFRAVMQADGATTRSLTALQHDPAFFPYVLPFVAPQVLEQHDQRLSVQRLGGHEEMVMLA